MRISPRIGATVALVGVALAAPSSRISAQASTRGVPETYAITNARIVPGTGSAIERGTVVIRDGLIVAVGANVATPADARVIDGNGLTVYPGLIDSYGSLGFPAPAAAGAAGRGARGAAPGGAPTEPQQPPSADHPVGIQPQEAAVELIHMGEDAFDGPRSVGITTALTAPSTGIIRGTAALIDLAGESVADAVVKTPVAMSVGFGAGGRGGGGGGGGGYPGALFGMFAAFRQELLDAQRFRDWTALYAKNPRGIARPPADAGLEALQPVINREMPVIIQANTEREISRALDLLKEFNLKGMIAGGAEADKVIDRLKADNVPVLLSLNFPRRTAAATPDADPEPLSVLRSRVDAPKVAAKLAQAGVKFAFESGGVTSWPDVLSNLAIAVQNGLSSDQALKALTTTPAELFGVSDRTGSIEAGKIANLTIARGDLFAKGTQVAQVFIDGRPVTMKMDQAGGGGRGARGGRGTPPPLREEGRGKREEPTSREEGRGKRQEPARNARN